MIPSERGIVFTNDLDGAHFNTRPSLRAALRLVRRIPLPAPGGKIGEYQPKGFKETTASRWSVFVHSRRSVNQEALEGLSEFRRLAKEHGRNLKFAALSGRESDKHDMTARKLREAGHMEYFDELFLNQGKRSIPWKESVIQRLLEEGQNVVHIDDDIRTGLCIARLNEAYTDDLRILVYVLSNLSNHPLLLKRAGISLPPNLLIVPNFKAAAVDFSKRLKERRF